ncbi:hypothetical protein CNMCM7691_004595 [Aspergillus felis]|uniref:Reverse transcriptase domain-containing protein n=1 Tax=Aspergillus felis TaxID=1287682 RepID=A0A8H6R179_9EURO|nr:hypothetical protein CNMCM7691_004595 [Aspergillus felis]
MGSGSSQQHQHRPPAEPPSYQQAKTVNGNAFRRYLQTDTTNSHIRTALLSCPSTQDAQVAGIGTTKTGYVIQFKDPESAEAARTNTKWLNELGNNTKLVKLRFGVIMHRTPTEDFNLENANAEAIEKIIEENDLAGQGYQIEEVAWLKRKDKPLGKFALLGIWFDSPEGAEHILNNSLLTWGSIPALQVGCNELVDNEDKARAFLDTFFPKLDEPNDDPPTQAPLELPWPPITELEIEQALKAAKSSTAPGEDSLTTLVWKHLWKFLNRFITGIFTVSVKLVYHPKRWRRAKIVVLCKPGKPDYLNPGAYRPISLLNTLGKLLEAVVARRLSYLTEKHSLLPDTQFGGRPGRTTEQALLVLSSAIDRACFMSDRFANIGFDDFCTKIAPLDNAGLAQGSPLSPILFTFFNSELVDQAVTPHGGVSAFIDDYFRWRVGPSAEDNLAKIQSKDIPRIEAWARQTGSYFAAEKTELIYLTRKWSQHLQGQVVMNGEIIKPSPTAKLLGVVFDQELRWKEHVQQAIKCATKVSITLAGLQHLRPEQMQQIYQACVTPVVDYSSTVWHDPLQDKTHLHHLNSVQRVSLIRILSAFRTVATTSLEVEAHILPTHLHLRYRAQKVIAKLHTLPHSHPIRSALSRAQKRRNNIGTSSRFPLAEALKTMNLERLDELETIDPSPLPPWRTEPLTEVEIGSD